MYNMLLYFLYGREVLWRAKLQLTEIERYSENYFQRNSPEDFERINRGRAVPLARTDYDFSGDWYGRIRRDPSAGDQIKTEFELLELDKMPTFAAEYRSGKYEGHYLPANVMVLVSPQTFSSGYTLMYYLLRAGAKIVGTPSVPAGNCFGEPLSFELQHSRLTGTISHKQYVEFHDDPEMGRVLRPHFPTTYEKLKSYDFDPNAEILLAKDEESWFGAPPSSDPLDGLTPRAGTCSGTRIPRKLLPATLQNGPPRWTPPVEARRFRSRRAAPVKHPRRRSRPAS
jgi:hypothetical protein